MESIISVHHLNFKATGEQLRHCRCSQVVSLHTKYIYSDEQPRVGGIGYTFVRTSHEVSGRRQAASDLGLIINTSRSSSARSKVVRSFDSSAGVLHTTKVHQPHGTYTARQNSMLPMINNTVTTVGHHLWARRTRV